MGEAMMPRVLSAEEMEEIRLNVAEREASMAFERSVTSTLPPLNPMSRAPRDGRPIVLMLVSGATVRAGWREDDMGWQVAKNGGALKYFVDGELMGWWPSPEVLP